jgi:hypothetical protein
MDPVDPWPEGVDVDDMGVEEIARESKPKEVGWD